MNHYQDVHLNLLHSTFQLVNDYWKEEIHSQGVIYQEHNVKIALERQEFYCETLLTLINSIKIESALNPIEITIDYGNLLKSVHQTTFETNYLYSSNKELFTSYDRDHIQIHNFRNSLYCLEEQEKSNEIILKENFEFHLAQAPAVTR